MKYREVTQPGHDECDIEDKGIQTNFKPEKPYSTSGTAAVRRLSFKNILKIDLHKLKDDASHTMLISATNSAGGEKEAKKLKNSLGKNTLAQNGLVKASKEYLGSRKKGKLNSTQRSQQFNVDELIELERSLDAQNKKGKGQLNPQENADGEHSFKYRTEANPDESGGVGPREAGASQIHQGVQGQQKEIFGAPHTIARRASSKKGSRNAHYGGAYTHDYNKYTMSTYNSNRLLGPETRGILESRRLIQNMERSKQSRSSSQLASSHVRDSKSKEYNSYRMSKVYQFPFEARQGSEPASRDFYQHKGGFSAQ